MTDERHTIHEADGEPVEVVVRRDGRLKKSARWAREPDGSILLRVPRHTSKREVARLLDDIARQLKKQRRLAARRTDDDLQARAERVNETYFGGRIRWTAIRWVGNMTTRLGSCSNGGTTDGHIRLSDRMKGWPDWVIDYVIAHELTHRVHPNHSAEFWEFLGEAYPLTERARGFIRGVAFAQGRAISEDGDAAGDAP
jgi:predicted metal-dependent hydrolase